MQFATINILFRLLFYSVFDWRPQSHSMLISIFQIFYYERHKNWIQFEYSKYSEKILQIKFWESMNIVLINLLGCITYFFRFINLLYKDESVYVCMCVCMSGSLLSDLHNQSPWNLAWAPHFTLARHRARGRTQMLTPGGTPYSDPVWKTLKGK